MKKESLSHIGSNIRAIRLRRHLTQTELAARLGMRPGPLNCIEKGRNLPSARVIHALSRALEVSVDAFFALPNNAFSVSGASIPYMKAKKTPGWNEPCALPARLPKELKAMSQDVCGLINQLIAVFLELEDICGAMKYTELQLGLATDRTEDGLSRLCNRVRQMLGINEAVIFDYLELLENAGLRILFCAMPPEQESFSCHDSKNGNAFIFVRHSEMTPEKQIFRLAYELGRLYMHAPDHYTNLPPSRTGRDRRGKTFTPDRAARRFSALFLMPETAMRATVRQLSIRPDEWTIELLYRIKHRFGVSAQTMLYRLRELKLIAPKLEKKFDAEIKAHYAKTGNKEPNSSRRILTPNGRIWDLYLSAGVRRADPADLKRIKRVLDRYGAMKV